MKKIFILSLLPLIFATGCADDPEPELPPASEGSYTVKLTADNSTLTTDDLTEAIQVEIPSNEDANVKYKIEIGAPSYLNTKSSVAKQITIKQGAYIKSVSTYKVEKITVDFYYGKGENFEVFNNVEHLGEPQIHHDSSIAPTEPEDHGQVFEYAINSNGWCVYNSTIYKPSFYYISVIFKK